MRIGICDDDIKWREYVENVLSEYLSKSSMTIELEHFSNKGDVEEYKGKPLDAVLMDIELDEENGIELALRINEKWENCKIIYLTNYLFYATEVYNTRHIHFVLKDEFQERCGEIVRKIIYSMEQHAQKLSFSLVGGGYVTLLASEILYFEREQRATVMHTCWGSYRMWDKISDIVEKLPEIDFVRCHNSYIVYLPAVLHMSKKNFTLKNGSDIAISRGYSNLVKQAFSNWFSMQL